MDISKLDLRLLVAFLVLMEEQNVTQAATRLNLSQPATSALLARLRDLFQDPLMLRTPRGMISTARAEALVPAVKQALAELEQLVSPPQSFDPRTTAMTRSLVAVDYVQAVIHETFVCVASREHPIEGELSIDRYCEL
jgi:DNA-binding transcriptional LysR family regulator